MCDLTQSLTCMHDMCGRGEDEFDQLVKISKVLGSEELHR
jgi:hypothetical protein